MADNTITFLPQHLKCEKSLAEHATLLDVALENNIDLDHACGGVCACSTCHVVIEEGFELLSPMQEDEEDQLDKAPGLTLRSRLACQAILQQPGAITVRIPNWNRNLVKEKH